MTFIPMGFDHIVLYVRDQAVSKAFYEGVLGCTVAKINPTFSIIHLRFGEQLIDLIPGNGPAKSEKEGLEHFCLSVKCDDMPAAAAELRKKGVQVEQENPKFFGAYGDSPSFYVRDPDGYKVELKAR
jgi:catechol 2,3-dioxygenase-like lactoylglutathione lyase family enzyme